MDFLSIGNLKRLTKQPTEPAAMTKIQQSKSTPAGPSRAEGSKASSLKSSPNQSAKKRHTSIVVTPSGANQSSDTQREHSVNKFKTQPIAYNKKDVMFDVGDSVELYNLHGELNEGIQQILKKAEKLLCTNEKDFLCAYSDHMSQVYKDLNDLRRQQQETNATLRRDEKVKEIQKRCQDFQDEALDLKGIVMKQKEKLETYKKKNDYLEDESKRLKIIQEKQRVKNRELRDALKQTHVNCKSLLQQVKGSGGVNAGDDLLQTFLTNLPPEAVGLPGDFNKKGSTVQQVVEILRYYGQDRDEAAVQIAKNFDAQVVGLKQSCQQMEKAIDKLKKERLELLKKNASQSKASVEGLQVFQECIEAVKKNVKNGQNDTGSQKRRSKSPSQASTINVKLPDTSPQMSIRSQNERLQIIEMFLKHPQIETVIQEILINGFSGNNINSGKMLNRGTTLATSKHTESNLAMFNENDAIFTLKESFLDMYSKTPTQNAQQLEAQPSSEYIKIQQLQMMNQDSALKMYSPGDNQRKMIKSQAGNMQTYGRNLNMRRTYQMEDTRKIDPQASNSKNVNFTHNRRLRPQTTRIVLKNHKTHPFNPQYNSGMIQPQPTALQPQMDPNQQFATITQPIGNLTIA